MTKNHRRNVLKGLAITLPAAWTTPLVKSVVLPAHALTSRPECATLTYPDLVITCNATLDPVEQSLFVVEESTDGCAVLASRSAFEPQPTATLLNFERFRRASTSPPEAYVGIGYILPNGSGGTAARITKVSCAGGCGYPNVSTIDNTPFEVIGTLGGSYTLRVNGEACLPDDGGTLTISVIRIE